MPENKQLIFEHIKNMKLLLTENVNKDDIIDSIQKQKVLYIYYAGDDTITKGYRTIEPYLLGVSTAGNVVVRAWQQAGASDSNKGIKRPRRPDKDAIPGWRLFYLDGITSILPTGKIFSVEEGKIRPKYNPNDKQMKEIFIAVDPTKKDNLVISGQDSIVEPNSTQKSVSMFKDQSDKFKSDIGYKSKPENEKKNVIDLYELITKHKKKSPSSYFVVNKDGQYYAVTKNGLNKFDNNDVLGNLKELFIKYSDNIKPSQSFFNQQRELFKNSLNKK